MNSVEGNKDIAVFKIRLLDVRICTSTFVQPQKMLTEVKWN